MDIKKMCEQLNRKLWTHQKLPTNLFRKIWKVLTNKLMMLRNGTSNTTKKS